MEELRAHEDDILGSYGWVDPATGIARIPIERAISLALGEEGPVVIDEPAATEEAH